MSFLRSTAGRFHPSTMNKDFMLWWTLSQLSYGLLKVSPPPPTPTLSRVDTADQKVESYLSGKCKQAMTAVICRITGTRHLSGGEAKHSEWQMASTRLWKMKAATARNWAELRCRRHLGALYHENHLHQGICLYPHNDPVRFGGLRRNHSERGGDGCCYVSEKRTRIRTALENVKKM